MKPIIAVIAVTLSVAAGSLGCGTVTAHPSDAPRESAHAPTVYACPMHPEQHSNHPGDCPICGMHLEPQRGSASATAGTQASDQRAR